MEIFKARCPSCQCDFDCDVSLLSHPGGRLRCPWCGRYFDRDSSPRLFLNPNRRPGADAGDPSIRVREFNPNLRDR